MRCFSFKGSEERPASVRTVSSTVSSAARSAPRKGHDNIACTPDTSGQALPERKVMAHDQSNNEVLLRLSPNVHTSRPCRNIPVKAPSSSNLSTKSLTFSPSRTHWAMNASKKDPPAPLVHLLSLQDRPAICTIGRPNVEIVRTSRVFWLGHEHVEHVIDSRRP